MWSGGYGWPQGRGELGFNRSVFGRRVGNDGGKKAPPGNAGRGFLMCLDVADWSPRQESNLYLALRRHLFYPLNYGEMDICNGIAGALLLPASVLSHGRFRLSASS